MLYNVAVSGLVALPRQLTRTTESQKAYIPLSSSLLFTFDL